MASDESAGEVDVAVPVDSVKIRARLHHQLRTCSAAVKRARAFEVQRTIKKLKTATEGEKESLEKELQSLKSSQHGQVAAIAIKSKLIKARLLPRTMKIGSEGNADQQFPLATHISELEALVKGSEMAAEKDFEAEKAKSKLLSNKVVSEEVSNIVKAISALLRGEEPKKQLQDVSKIGARKEKKALAKDKEIVEKQQVKVKNIAKSNLDTKRGAESADEVDMGLDFSGDEDKSSVFEGAELNSKSLKPKSIAQNGKRPNEFEGEDDVGRATKQRRREPDSESNDSSTDEEVDSSRGLLPALSTGFVGGRGFNLGRDSEDEWSDGDADLDSIDEDADGTGNAKEARKNRKGQRARRAIWEKKFGKGANHLKLLEKEKRQRAPLRRTNEMQTRQDQGGLARRDAGWSGALGKEPAANNVTLPSMKEPPPSKVETEMHPSWIAKQKQKERAEAAAQSRGTAKKIVFD